jgi:mRNA-degrading endonuclease RelE of RelBE toxin-antitoxin system
VRIALHRNAEKSLRRMPSDVALNILARLESIAADPEGLAARRHRDVKAFGDSVYRLRVTKWRAIFEVIGDELIVTVIDTREDAYR